MQITPNSSRRCSFRSLLHEALKSEWRAAVAAGGAVCSELQVRAIPEAVSGRLRMLLFFSLSMAPASQPPPPPWRVWAWLPGFQPGDQLGSQGRAGRVWWDLWSRQENALGFLMPTFCVPHSGPQLPWAPSSSGKPPYLPQNSLLGFPQGRATGAMVGQWGHRAGG